MFWMYKYTYVRSVNVYLAMARSERCLLIEMVRIGQEGLRILLVVLSLPEWQVAAMQIRVFMVKWGMTVAVACPTSAY